MVFLKKRFQKIGHQNKQLLIESALAFIVRSFAAVAAFFMNMVVARQLGAHQAGYFFLCIAFITVAGVIFAIGGNSQLLRFIGVYSAEKKWNHVNYVFWQMAKWVILLSVFSSIFLIISRNFIAEEIFRKKEMAPTLFWMLLTTPIYTVTTLLGFAMQGIRKISMSICVQGIFVQVTLTLLVLIFKPHYPDAVGKLYFFVSIGTLFIAVFSWRKFVCDKKEKLVEKLELPPAFWKSSFTLWAFSILQISIQWAGQFIAGIYCKPEDLAKLAVAQRTSVLISFILIAINLVSAPRFASLYKQGKMDELKNYAINATRLMVAFATPIVLIMLIFPHFVLMLFGKGFDHDDAVFMLRVLVLGQYVNILTGSVAYLLMMSGHEKELRNITLMSGIGSIVLNVFAVKMYGTFGAAIAIAISVALQNLLAVSMVKKKLGFSTLAIWK